MAAAVVALGHEVHIFTTDQDGAGCLNVPTDRPVVRDGVYIHYFATQIRRGWNVSLPLARALRDRVREFDVVHVHSLYLFHGMVAGHYCRKWGVPYIIRPHGTLDPYIHKRHRLRKRVVELLFERRNFRGASAVHYTTEDEHRLAQPFVFGAPGFVVPLGFDLTAYHQRPGIGSLSAAFPELRGKKVVLFLGRINFKKGLDILVHAMSTVLKTNADAHLVIAGPDSDGLASTVKEWICEKRIESNVTFTGMLEGQTKLAALFESSVFVLPSYSENFGIAVVEAMACGLPVIVSDKVNICHEIAEARAGVVVPCEAEKCAEAIVFVLNNDESAREFGRRGRELANSRYSLENVGKALVGAYGDTVNMKLSCNGHR